MAALLRAPGATTRTTATLDGRLHEAHEQPTRERGAQRGSTDEGPQLNGQETSPDMNRGPAGAGTTTHARDATPAHAAAAAPPKAAGGRSPHPTAPTSGPDRGQGRRTPCMNWTGK